MSNLGSKFKKRDLTLNVNRFLFQKFGIPNPKAGQSQKLVKSLVNTDICAWYCMRFFELLIIDDVQKGYFGLCLTLFVCCDLRPWYGSEPGTSCPYCLLTVDQAFVFAFRILITDAFAIHGICTDLTAVGQPPFTKSEHKLHIKYHAGTSWPHRGQFLVDEHLHIIFQTSVMLCSVLPQNTSDLEGFYFLFWK